MAEEITQPQPTTTAFDIGPVSWWSWRPGIKPRSALLIGGLISCVALLLASIGLTTLVLGILDSLSQPFQVPAIVTKHIANSLDGQPRLSFRLHTSGFPAQDSAIVSDLSFQTIHDGDHVLLDYTPHLHLLYELENASQHYPLPNSGAGGIFIGSAALLLLGLCLVSYPIVLANWGWRDLYGRKQRQMTARVVALRAAVQTRAARPGLTPRPSRTWYGVALCPINVNAPSPPNEQQVMTFAISADAYRFLHKGAMVRIRYSHHLHYVYALEALEAIE